MGYGLGVDLGTTFTAAAVVRDGRVEMASLGDRSASVPSVVLLRADGVVLTGDAAHRRAASEPDRVAREVKRRLGDPTPILLGGAPQPVQELMAMQLRDVVRAVSEREGGPPDSVTLTHPANWGPYKKELFEQIPPRAGLDRVGMITEPEGAAAHYASTERVPDGAIVAVYDLGGGTFDATVVRKSGDGFEILGTPEGIEGIGGIDFDEAVYAHVDRALDGALSALDPADERATSAAIRLRNECVLAKEALSADTETTIPVMLPDLQTEVRLTRGEFETMVVPSVTATVESMRRALRSAGVTPEELHTVLLVGGSSRIPAVARMVSAELGRPTSVDAHPKHSICMGAAALAGRSAAPAGTPGPAAGAGVAAAGAAAPAGGPADDALTPPNGLRAVPGGPGPGTPPGGLRGPAYGAAAATAGLSAAPQNGGHGTAAMGAVPGRAEDPTAVHPAARTAALPTTQFGAPDGEAPRSAAGTPPPSLGAGSSKKTKKERRAAAAAGAPDGPRRGGRKAGVWIGGGVLVAAAAVGAVYFLGIGQQEAPAPVPAAATSAPPTPTPTPTPAPAAAADSNGSDAPTTRRRAPRTTQEQAPASEAPASQAPVEQAPAAQNNGTGGSGTGGGAGGGTGGGSGGAAGGSGSSGTSGTGSSAGTGTGTGGQSGTGTTP